MRVHVVGPGVVGSATANALKRFGHEVVTTDKGDRHSEVAAEVHLICTPEGVAPEVAHDVVKGCLARLQGWDGYGSDPAEAVAIRSSVPPGTCTALSRTLGYPVFHVPEFLRAATAEQDVLEALGVLIGFPEYRAPHDGPCKDRLRSLWEDLHGQNVGCIRAEYSEMVKLAINNHLAVLVAFWGSMGELAERLGLNGHVLSRLASDLDDRVSPYGSRWYNRYAGACLPKDMRATLRLAAAHGVDLPLHEAAERFNNGLT